VSRLHVLALLLIAVGSGCKLRPRDAASRPTTIPTSVVRDGAFQITIPVTGQLDAAEGVTVISEYGSDKTSWGGKIKWVAEDGKPIQKGALVMELVAPETEGVIQQLELELESAKEETREAESSSEREVEHAKAALRKAEERLALAKAEADAGAEKDQAALTFAREELGAAEGELAKRRRLAEAKLTPRSRVDEAADTVTAKQFEVDKAEEELKTNKDKRALEAAARQLEIDKAKLELDNAVLRQRLRIEKAREKEDSIARELGDERQVLTKARIFAPESGILMLEQTWDQGLRPRRAGDTVWHYSRVARIVSFDKMMVRCQFGELDMARVEKGQSARVRVMGLPGLVLPGRIKVVESLATEGDPWEGMPAGKRVCAAIVEVLDSDPRLRPGMTAMVEIVVGRGRGLHVPVECLFRGSSKSAVVYRREGSRYRAVPVKPGARSDLVVAVDGDIRRGDRVARQRPPQRVMVAARTAKE